MKQMTVRDLKMFVNEQIHKGNGDKYIVISNDSEGNGYHGLFFEFTSKKKDIENVLEHSRLENSEKDLDKIVILG